ncbi:helix-turn-helix domain-containing protein [Thermoactinomyces mirandus]|uniref:Helix-turn-helix domain-containing protein n=1 Tax=Thermoactinomyces mirandus TaxID=2756294 RepID=A0A7W1XV30_9BACL|nr:helix-turn-helix domain-containing protein [Thermoactinomyces mirandus]MBA4603736.1 helix-turn-helix domain-containing protein [Thermoactinomyces mirandus]
MSVEIGSYLRQAREAIGLSLEQLQEKTKIQKSFLIAIENGEFDKLPSPFYVRTYLRSYANCVKVEPHHILRQYRKMEQAERLTGVHKAVTPNDLQQTQGLPPLGKWQQTGKMPVVNSNNPTQNTVRMKTLPTQNSSPHRFNTQTLPTQNTSPHRINTQTALTAAKKNPNRTNERAQTRRDLGYQRTTGINQRDPSLTASETTTGYTSNSRKFIAARKELYPTAASRTRQTGYHQQVKAQSGYQQGQTTSPNQRLMSNTGPVSRASGSFKKVDLNKAPLPSVSPDELDKSSGEVRHQRLSRMNRLGRSASRSRRGAKKSLSKFSFKSPVAMAVAGLLLCIPLGWTIMSFTGDDVQPDPAPKRQEKESTEPPVIAPDKKGELQLAQQDVNVVHYRLEGTDQIVVMVHAAGGKSRVELSTALPSDGGTPIEDVTLPHGQKWSYQYTYSGNSDFYIGLSAPEDSIVYINGQVVKSARYVHIRKMD